MFNARASAMNARDCKSTELEVGTDALTVLRSVEIGLPETIGGLLGRPVVVTDPEERRYRSAGVVRDVVMVGLGASGKARSVSLRTLAFYVRVGFNGCMDLASYRLDQLSLKNKHQVH